MCVQRPNLISFIRSRNKIVFFLLSLTSNLSCVHGRGDRRKHSLINLCVCVPLRSQMISVYLSITHRRLTLVNLFATELTTAITVCSEVSLPLQRLSAPNPPLMNVIPHPSQAHSHQGASFSCE